MTIQINTQNQPQVIFLQAPTVNYSNGASVRSTLRKHKVNFVCGIIFVICAVLLIIPEIVRVSSYSHKYFLFSGVGIWSGLFILIAGILSIIAFKNNSRNWLASALVMESIALVVMGIAGIFCGIETHNNNYEADYLKTRYHYQRIFSRLNNSSSFIRSHDRLEYYYYYNLDKSDVDFILRFIYVIIGTICVVSITLIIHIAFCCCELCFCCSKQNLLGHVAGPVQYMDVNSTGTEPTQPNQAALNTTVHQVNLMPGQTSFSIIINSGTCQTGSAPMINVATTGAASAYEPPNSGHMEALGTGSVSMKEAEAIGATSAAESSNTTAIDLLPGYDDAMANLLPNINLSYTDD